MLHSIVLYIYSLQAYSTARLNVEVMLISYNNSDSEDCDGDPCDGSSDAGGMCGNIFEFCLRPRGGGSCLLTLTSNEISEDRITFTPSELSQLGLSNPLLFPDISTSVRDCQ